MAVTSGFFDSVSGDRTYDADQMSTYFEGLVSDGVYENIGDRFLVTAAASGLSVNVASGRALIQSHWIKNDSIAVLNLDPADVAMNRIDAVCLRLDESARAISLTIKKGTAVSGNPEIPAITRTGGVYEIYIAAVLVNRGATRPSAITDLRPSTYCGWVTGLIKQVSTADLFTQWQAAYAEQFAEFDAYIAAKQAAFNEWFALLTSTLNVYTGLTKYQRRWIASASDSGAVIGLLPHEIDTEPEVKFDADLDVLIAYANGKYLAQDKDYVILRNQTSYPPYRISLTGGKTFGEICGTTGNVNVDFLILRNEIGKQVVIADDAILQTYPITNSTVATAEEVSS